MAQDAKNGPNNARMKIFSVPLLTLKRIKCHLNANRLTLNKTYMKRFLAACVLLAGMLIGHAQTTETPKLKFHNGRFRVVQFTDFHWEYNTPAAKLNKQMVLDVVQRERPDLCMLTGDVVTARPAREGWLEVRALFEEAGVPFAFVSGNHDPEFMPLDSIFSILSASKLFVGKPGPSELHGTGNYALPIFNAGGVKPQAVIYCFDSGMYTDNQADSYYDWLHLDQINWYTEQSNKFRSGNANRPLPALAYFHICVPEYRALLGTPALKGHSGEDCCPADLNSGFFTAAYAQNDIMGMFVGHDHSNDFIGLYKGIALGYGRQSGVMGRDKNTPLGARVVELKEGKKQFDTWISDINGPGLAFHYPLGTTSDDEQHMTFLPAQKAKAGKHGVRYTYYEGKFKHTDHIMASGEKKAEGTLDNISIAPSLGKDHFGYIFQTLFMAPERGIYKFTVQSDDGALLLIDGVKVADNDGSHSLKAAAGYVAIEKGLHRMELRYFDDYMGETLSVKVASLEIDEQPLPANLLYQP